MTKPNWFMMAAAYGARRVYLPFKIRIRNWGSLPAGRGATVLITNHQHMDEGETVTGRVFFRHPWKPLVMCNSRRTFETGFFAARIPWTARFTRGLNLSGLWASCSILPIENHLFARPLISIAEEVRAAHGDVKVDDLVEAATLAEIGLAGRTLSQLWELDDFAKAQAWVKLSQLRQPYRREVVANLRKTVASDVAAIVERVREGATFYITPEGDFSRDGRMHPMRPGIVEAVLPFADPWLCGVSYDPFRGKRLPMLFRFVHMERGAVTGTALAAARPVTTSALLAGFLLDAPEPFSKREAEDAVMALRSLLPPNVFVDPELDRAPAIAVGEAIDGLCGRGTLAREGRRYRLTAQRGDPRFPHVADMVTFQRNMLEETIACASAPAATGPG